MPEFSQYYDDLTGVLNRRYLSEQLMAELNARIADRHSFTLAIIDIDHFKDINDTYGHLRGDNVIKQFVIFLKQSLRGSDLILRYGGDEFLSIMNDTLKNDAEGVLNRIADHCRQQKFADLSVTFSAGVASFPGDGNSYEEVFANADQALYEAKRLGRDRISIVGEKKAEIPIKVFIGRRREKEIMQTVVADSSQRLRVAIIHGLVGIGKTRLSREVLSSLREREIIWTDCLQFDHPLPYYVVRELIRYRLKRLGADFMKSLSFPYLMEIGKLVPELLAGKKEISIGAEVLDRYRLYESIRQIIEMGQREKIIVVDNVQWIDGESLEVLKYAIRALRESPLTFIFIHREEEISSLLEDFFAFLSRDFETRKIALNPFDQNEIRDALWAILGDKPYPDLVDYVLRESGGVPLYIEDIVRGLLERQYLNIVQGQWHFTTPAETIMPDTVSDIAIKKYRSLSREAQQVLDIATILGWFEPTVIRRITGFNEGHVLGLISEIDRLGMIKYQGNRYEFSAALNRSAIYQKYLEGPRSIDLHRRVAEELEALHLDQRGDYTDNLAYHFYQSRDNQRGVFYCRQAGDRARALYANQDAIRYYTWAVELIGSDQKRRAERLAIVLRKAEVFLFIGRAREAQEIIDAIQDEINNLGDQNLAIALLVLQMNINVDRAQYDRVIEIGNELLKRYKPESVFNRKPDVLSYLGRAHYRQGDYEKAKVLLDEALKICLDKKDEISEAKVRINLGNVYHTVGDNLKALENYQRCLDIHRRSNSLDGEARILTNLSNVYNQLGQIEEAFASVKRAAEIFQIVGNLIDEARALNNLGTLYDKAGQFDEARSLFERALNNHRQVGNKEGIALVTLNIGSNYWNDGQAEKALSLFDKALQNELEVKSQNLITSVYLSQAFIYLEKRQFDMINAILDWIIKGIEISQELAVACLSFLCDYYLTIGDDQRFQEAVDGLAGLARSVEIPEPEAYRHQLLGRYSLAHGQFDKARAELMCSLNQFQKLRDRRNIAISYYFLAQLEKKRGHKAAYNDYYQQAKHEFTEIKWRLWLKKMAEEEKTS